MRNFKNYTIKVATDESKSYFHASAALKDAGFEEYSMFENWNPVSGVDRREVFERISDGRLFVFAGMENYNTTIYHIKMRELTEAGKKCLGA